MLVTFIITIVTALANSLLALAVLFRAVPSRANRLFAFIIAGMSFWIVTLYVSELPVVSPLLWNRLVFLPAIPIGISFFYFSLLFADRSKTVLLNKISVYMVLLVGLLFVAFTFSPLIVQRLDYSSGRLELIRGPLHPLLVITFLFFMVAGLAVLVSKYWRLSGVPQLQIRYLSLGSAITTFFVALTNLIYPLITGSASLSLFGPLGTVFFVGFTTYAIAKHRLMDIRLAIRAFILKVLFGGIIAGGAYLVSRVFTMDLVETTEVNIGVAVTFAAFVVVFIYGPLDRFLRRVTDAVLFQREYNRQVLLNRLGKDLSESINLKELEGRIRYTLKEALRVQTIRFQLRNHSTDVLWEQVKAQPELIVYDEWVRDLEDRESDLRQQQREKVLARMRELEAAVVLPLPTAADTIGMILLGEKQGGDAFTSQDIDALETLRYQAGVAIENALLYQQVKDFNVELQKKVEQATRELSVKNKQLMEANIHLQELDQLKTDLVGMASHELKTPMTIIMSYLWMALNRQEEKVGRAEYQQYLQRAYESSQRLIDQVDDMLSVSKLEGGQTKLELEELDLAEVVGKVVEDLKTKAVEKGLKLELRPPAGPLPPAVIDKNRFIEIITNLVGNSVKYTDQGKIKVEMMSNTERAPEWVLKQEQDREGVEPVGKFLWVTVTDTGRGIAEKDIPRLFQKFGKLEQGDYVKSAETGGTGLGLYITKGLVELHGGSIWVESPPVAKLSLALQGSSETGEKGQGPVPDGTGQGSTFGFSVRAAG